LTLLYINNLLIYFNNRVKKLEDKGLTTTTFLDSNEGVINEVEGLFKFLKGRSWNFFQCRTPSDLVVADEPTNGWSKNELMR
jgi:hypothetical protein